MATIGSVLKDQLAVFDHRLQELRRTIDWAHAEISKVQDARLKLTELMEEAMGPPEEERGHVVVQKMAFVDRRIAEAQQLAPPKPQDSLPGGPADDGEASHLARYGPGTEELERRHLNKVERDRKAYQRRKAAKKAGRKTQGPRPHTWLPGGWAQKIVAHLKDASAPLGFREIALHHGVTDHEERTRLRSALTRLKGQGLITNPPGEPGGTGNRATYMLVRSNGNGAAHP